MDTVLQTQSLTIGYPPRVLLADAALALRAGELVCLIGANGAGKSTLLRTLTGMQPPLRGRVLLNGADLAALPPGERAKRVSVVLTGGIGADVPALTVRLLVALGRHPHTDWSGRLSAHDAHAVEDALARTGITALAERQVGALSDGERQKALIARALAQDAPLMLLDEPTAFLDLPSRAEILLMLRELARTLGRAVLLSTHDLDTALHSADRLWLLAGGTLHDGAPEDLVLRGALAVFDAGAVRFDPHSGGFRLRAPARGVVRLDSADAGELRGADDLRHLWTLRALERAGFRAGAVGERAVTLTPGGWTVDGTPCASLYAVLRALDG